MERINNNEFKGKKLREQTQYLKDGDDDNSGNIKQIRKELKAMLGILIFIAIAISGIAFDSIFLN